MLVLGPPAGRGVAEMELVMQCLADVKTRPSRVKIKGKYVVLDTEQNGYKYEFPLSRCNTPEKLLAWCHQLAPKTWMTGVMVRDLIEAVHHAAGVPVEFGT
jgi:hypothetical protein